MKGNSLKEDLLRYNFSLKETHISWVFLGPDKVYKVKKPLSLGFLDFTTLQSRLSACQAELDLNRRLAPDVYLQLVPITWSDKTGHQLEGSGEIVDWAVEMVRLEDKNSAEMMIFGNTLSDSHIEMLAEKLASFHQNCKTDKEKSHHGAPAAIKFNIQENFEQTRVTGPKHLAPLEIEKISRFQLKFLEKEQDLLNSRVRDGYVRDGHGDLRLEHVYFSDQSIQIIDCIEFNERFRYADVCSDIAFLYMDLVFHNRTDLADLLLSRYTGKTFDYGIYRLIDFYMSYRAYTRAKVTSLLEEQNDLPEETRTKLHNEARKYFLLAEAASNPPLQRPILLVVFGGIASGKSTLASHLGLALSAPVISSDKTRKHLSGVGSNTSLADTPFSGAYDENVTGKVYDEIYKEADMVLGAGRPVIIDATCSKITQRNALRQTAAKHGVKVLMIECFVPEDICRSRLHKRSQQPNASDANIDIYDEFMARYQKTEELPQTMHLILDTNIDSLSLVNRVLDHLSKL